ncbi:MAG: FAD-dependent thymidylate synthase [Acidimicrobiia bacterium]|nr:MAG: FAD-dependent thymidylate synthase [Acidimicrobiia bacterium]
MLAAVAYVQEPFTDEEAALLSRYVSNVDRPVFALMHLPEVVKGALFARYSRTSKSVRRLLLDEFIQDREGAIEAIAEEVGTDRAAQLYDRVFLEYGDDSVAQLGGVHLACEQASNVLTKALEWGRLASYLEQSTRYIPYDEPLGGRYRYTVPPEIARSPLADRFTSLMDDLFSTYSDFVGVLIPWFEERHPKEEGDSNWVWRSTIKAKAFDTVRGMLPAATTSNLGIYASGQAFEQALIRLRAHPLEEARDYADLMLDELRVVIPEFLTRVDRIDRGDAWGSYLASIREATEAKAAELASRAVPDRAEVTLVDWDPDAELKVAAAALYAGSELPDDVLLDVTRDLSAEQLDSVFAAMVGERGNRRHKPGRAAERTSYRFDVLSDYGAFRDLQRHRLLTIEWQRLSTRHGYATPATLGEVGLADRWHGLMAEAAELYEAVRGELGPDVAQYVVPFAYRIRYMMQFNAREAFHLLELRTQPAGHPDYRRVCQEMHRLIGEVAGHHRIQAAMSYVDHSTTDLERLEESRRIEAKRSTST